MKKGIRLLAALAAAVFLLGGCGTQLDVMTGGGEELIVQGAAYMLSKHNIHQKDGMNGAPPQTEEGTEQTENTQQPAEQESQEGGPDAGGPTEGAGQPAQSAAESISLAEAIGYADQLSVSYEGYSLMDVYQEGTYFSLSAESGNTFVVMRFSIHNDTGADIRVNNFDRECAFYCSFEAAGRVPEKESFITDSLASFEGTVEAGKAAGAVLIFEITKEQAELVSDPGLTMEQNGISYTVNL